MLLGFQSHFKSCDAFKLFLLSTFFASALSYQYPIGTLTDRNLPILGSPAHHLQAWPWLSNKFWDPEAQILCVGSVPANFGPIPQNWLPPSSKSPYELFLPNVYKTIRSLCAKTAYGGSYEAWNAGGYCARSVSPPTVIFEQLPPEDGELPDLVKRVFLLCQNSCRCIPGNRQELIEQGRPARKIVEEERAGFDGWMDRPEVSDISREHPERAKLHDTYSPSALTRKIYIPVYFLPEIDARSLRAGSVIVERHASTTLWLPHFENLWAPTCEDDEPNSAGLGAFRASSQQICAAEWFGGSRRGNVGLVCARENYVLPSVEKSMQHPVYRDRVLSTFVGPNNVYKATVINCKSACVCPDPPKPTGSSLSSLVEGVYDLANDFISGIKRFRDTHGMDGFASSSDYDFGRGGGASSLFQHGSFSSVLRRQSMCRSNKVNGFDLAGSIAAQSLCRTSAKRLREWRGQAGQQLGP